MFINLKSINLDNLNTQKDEILLFYLPLNNGKEYLEQFEQHCVCIKGGGNNAGLQRFEWNTLEYSNGFRREFNGIVYTFECCTHIRSISIK